MKKSSLWGIATLLTTLNLGAQQLTLDIITQGLQENPGAFERVVIESSEQPVRFDIQLGESTATVGEEHLFDGFRFKVPEAGKDFVWYFNAPSHWGHWYILPVSGEAEGGFKRWLDADKVYQHFDEDEENGRFRVLQTLDADYFEADKEYIIWFRRKAENAASSNALRGVLAFVDQNERWDYDDIEEVLELEPKSPEHQVKQLDSRGGSILLDTAFFSRDDARRRIDNVFTSLRTTKRMSNGMFVTMETACPPCKTEPSLKDIRKKYGEPDFILTQTEDQKVREHGGRDPSENAEEITTYYYDYFGFEVSSDDDEQRVVRVVTHADDYSVLTPEDGGAYYAQVPMKNLTVFHDNHKEVGRLYYFLEGGKEPLCMNEPPKKAFRNKNLELDYQGSGKWTWSTYADDGGLAREIPLKEHRLNGMAKGFYRNGQASFAAPYKDGLLEGEVVQYLQDGTESKRIVYREGKRISSKSSLTLEEAKLFPGDIPSRVRYTRPETADAEAARALLTKVFLSREKVELFGGVAAVYPPLWQEIKDKKPYSEDPGSKMTTFSDGEKMDGKGLKSEAAQAALVKFLQDKFSDPDQTVIRPPNYSELQSYWSIIGWDLSSPLFVVQNGKFRYIFEFQDGWVFTVYDLHSMKL